MHDGNPMLFHTTQGGGFVQGSSCKAQENLPNPVLQEKKTPDIEQTNGALTVQWISTNFHESKQVQLECIRNPVAVKMNDSRTLCQ